MTWLMCECVCYRIKHKNTHISLVTHASFHALLGDYPAFIPCLCSAITQPSLHSMPCSAITQASFQALLSNHTGFIP